MSFIDFSLLEYIIKKFCSNGLQTEMKSYRSAMQIFMRQTTVAQLIDHWPGEQEVPPNFTMLITKIDEDPATYTLEKLDKLRRKYCVQIKLSDVICVMIGMKESSSFIVMWRVPLVVCQELKIATHEIANSFFTDERITLIQLGDDQLYPSVVHRSLSDDVNKQYLATPMKLQSAADLKVVTFGAELKEQYQQDWITSSPIDWISSPTKKIFKLALIQREQVRYGHIEDSFVQMTISGKVDDVLHVKTPIDLTEILKTAQGVPGESSKVVLIEGAPGSGKSTLTIHICREWGRGELFQEFTVIILVQLRDPIVQAAQSIADLLPCNDPTLASEIAAQLEINKGRGVLWIFDGWDELPTHLQQNSILRKLIPTKPVKRFAALSQPAQQNQDRLLQESSIIITSRPISSGDLHPVISSRIEVIGFTPDELNLYFAECLKEDTKVIESLSERIQENPFVQSICYLPLNAAFVVHIFKYKSLLPSSEYEIFATIIIFCVVRHYQRMDGSKVVFDSLDDICVSQRVGESFCFLCWLAYQGVMQNRITFHSSDIPQELSTLSLLQGVESFLQRGKSVYYNFLHLSIQELLAAYFIGKFLDPKEQVQEFQRLFRQPRFISVFQFYAAITKLKSPGIDSVIIHNISQPSFFIPLIRCLFEAKDVPLNRNVVEWKKEKFDYGKYSLSPLYCFSIGYFLSTVHNTSVKEIYVELQSCSIGNQGVQNIMGYLQHGPDVDDKVTTLISLGMQDNNIRYEGVLSIARALLNGKVISKLNLSENPIGGRGLHIIAESLRNNHTLIELNLSRCSLKVTEENGPFITEMLQNNSSLKILLLYNNLLLSDTGTFFIGKGLLKNHSLQKLHLSYCGLTSKGIHELSTALSNNNSLKELHIGRNKIRDEGLAHLANALQQNKSLNFLSVNSCEMSDTGLQSIADAVNVNGTLKTLHVFGNKLSKPCLFEVLSKITGVTEVWVIDNFKYEYRDQLSEIRAHNGLPKIEIIGKDKLLLNIIYVQVLSSFYIVIVKFSRFLVVRYLKYSSHNNIYTCH